MDLSTEIGLWVLALRKDRKLSRRAAADAVGISQWKLASFEVGRPIPLPQLARLFKVYQVNPEYAIVRICELSMKYRGSPHAPWP